MDAIAEAEAHWGIELRHATGDEYIGPCPFCHDGEDRFHVWQQRRNYWCRVCDAKGFLDQEAEKPSPEEIRLRKIEHEQRRQARRQRELEDRVSALEFMAQCTDHIGYNHTLDEGDRDYWHQEGFRPENVDRFLLGVCYACPTDRDHRPSYTIPVFGHDGATLWNIVHRLIGKTSDKYRPHRAGLGKQLVRAHALQGAGEAIIVEGAKKALICSQYGINAIGLQGCSGSFPMEWVDWMSSVRRLWIAFDPDANRHGFRLGAGLAKALPHAEVRVCAFPVKPDDLFARHHGTEKDFRAILEAGRLMRSTPPRGT